MPQKLSARTERHCFPQSPSAPTWAQWACQPHSEGHRHTPAPQSHPAPRCTFPVPTAHRPLIAPVPRAALEPDPPLKGPRLQPSCCCLLLRSAQLGQVCGLITPGGTLDSLAQRARALWRGPHPALQFGSSLPREKPGPLLRWDAVLLPSAALPAGGF